MSDIMKVFSSAQAGLVTQQSDFSLSAIYDMIKQNSIEISPHYQRRDRWSTEKQSALIESFLLNVPVPPVYLSEDDYGTYSVIDGKQRLTAIFEFLGGKLKLKGLTKFPDLEGYKFEELPNQLKNALIIRPFIRVITLLQQSEPSLKYEVFIRLNTGGEKLKPQEIRNVAYSGPLNDLLLELSDSPFLKQQMKIKSKTSTPYRNMDDVEMVLRFLAIEDRWEAFGRKLAPGMDEFMSKNRKELPDLFRRKFVRAISGCESLWGDKSFQKPVDNNGWREQFIAPLYDAQMVAVASLSDAELDTLKGKPQDVLAATRGLFENDPAFVKAVSQATSDTSAINKRVSVLLELLKGMC
ncbi:DUF262 domain-containing protein [Vibrio crassostreae]|nr:DUF262 domain-containing protein [Vibrio crassostreae]CAK1694667.1 DUF262 domain-containing protein [Vibrio crassostreae]CAK1712827.1 DUF262 domain-containing protein [Vibrio crassostreae]CAK1712994.1 DUF262 domain-containing protein [Vibrio crassostreae]CAK1722172.1 DUF262 domain-containing protein [Vibrio crassostreae]